MYIFQHTSVDNAVQHVVNLELAGWAVYRAGLIVMWEQPEE